MAPIRNLAMMSLVVLAASGLGERPTRGQGAASLADDIIAISAGEHAKESARDTSALRPAIGTAARPFESVAGADESRLGAPPPRPRTVDVLSAASRPDRARIAATTAARRADVLPPALPALPELPPEAIPLEGLLAPPDLQDEGPADGLTLDQAIGILIRSNPSLQIKFQEIPKAEADVLTAGLWGNPLVFASFDKIPYDKYSPQRPGSNGYGITLVQPFDINGKTRARIQLAETAKSVLQAQYQDAVRLELERLHTAWIDALSARTSAQFLNTSRSGYAAFLQIIQKQVQDREAPEADLDAAVIQHETAVVEHEEAITRYRGAKRNLAVLLHISPSQADQFELRGAVHDLAPPPPPREELIRVALQQRPDLNAVRLGVRSALANVELEKRERFPDVFAMYTPYGFDANNDTPGASPATSWGAGIFASVPLLNRNQGHIRRAELNVRQTQIEVAALESQVIAEVENAVLEYESSRAAVDRFERAILPRAAKVRDDRRLRYTSGDLDLPSYLSAQRDYNASLRVYRDVLIRHRRGMLALNTAVGTRILP